MLSPVAGGMRGGWNGPTLADRAASSGVAQPPASEPAGSGRHCWVRDPPDAPGTWAGLLVEWRAHPDGWQGRVSYTVRGRHGPTLVEAWLPASGLEPR